MPHSNFVTLVSNYILAGGATGGIELDCSDYTEAQLFLQATYATSASTTGLAASGSDGVGPRSPISGSNVYVGHPTLNPTKPIFYDSQGFGVTLNPTLPSSTNITTVTKINLVIPTLGNWIKLSLLNKDATNPVTISLYGDCN